MIECEKLNWVHPAELGFIGFIQRFIEAPVFNIDRQNGVVSTTNK